MARNYVAFGLAIVLGIGNGYYCFQPILKEQNRKSEFPLDRRPQADSASNDATSK
ncbi:hypothetical protein GGS24DRAFT_498954 [Hypoxylon argillaceum]|nr:hypothetical protein GGS24DRAFT_498954 [Hypoxylon argillaceum]KAI1152976.1 hypothetical protein F4825DRAFT_449947 [Nemania diffusa]